MLAISLLIWSAVGTVGWLLTSLAGVWQGLTLLSMTSAYAVFANGGTRWQARRFGFSRPAADACRYGALYDSDGNMTLQSTAYTEYFSRRTEPAVPEAAPQTTVPTPLPAPIATAGLVASGAAQPTRPPNLKLDHYPSSAHTRKSSGHTLE